MRSERIVLMLSFLAFSNASCGEHSATGGTGGGSGGIAGGGSGGAVVGGGGAGGMTAGGHGGAAFDGAGVSTGGNPDVAVGGAGGSGGGGAAGGETGGRVDGAPTPIDSALVAEGGGTGIDTNGVADEDSQAIDGEAVSTSRDYVMIAADNLAASAARYRDFRKVDGSRVDLAMVGDIVGDAPDVSSASARILDYVRSRYQTRDPARPLYLLLLGDAQATWPGDRAGVPAGTWEDPSNGASVVSDNVYADMDGDDVPDIAVGRITADTDAELDLVRAKVADYETSRAIGAWDRRLSIFASTSGMGAVVDTAIESVVYAITEAIPYDFDVTMTYARQSSPYVYIPEQFSDQVYRRINEGSLLVAYVGHGYRDGFATLDWNGVSYPILDTAHLENLAVTHKAPILLFVACSTGAFVGGESVSERILAQADAPNAIFSSTEVSDPYANAIFIYEVSQAFAATRVPTVGDAFLLAKQRMIGGTDAVRQQIESLSALLVSASAKEELKHSHLHMYTLFADPGMAVVYPGAAQVSVTPASASAGAELAVTAGFPALAEDGEAIVTLESARRTILGSIAPVPPDGDAGRDAVIVENYQTANDKVVVGLTLPVSGSSLSTTLHAPTGLPAGEYHVKVFAHDGSSDYAGSALVSVR